MLPNQATLAHYLPHHDPIFLLHKALIPFLIGASSRKGNLLTHTIGSDFLIDKLPPLSVSNPGIGNGKSARARWRAASTASLPRLSRGRLAVQPLATSVGLIVYSQPPCTR